MGYTTDFSGTFKVSPPLDDAQVAYLKRFAETRRMQRDAAIVATMPDPLREAVGLPVGHDGCFYVPGEGNQFGQDRDRSIMDYNNPPGGSCYTSFSEGFNPHTDRHTQAQPSLWCQWVPTDDGAGIEWDEGEKFYEYVTWLQYLVDHMLEPWGRVLSGEVNWTGEDSNDTGVIVVVDNEITTREGHAPRPPKPGETCPTCGKE